jgi:hypothetical protein
MAMIMAFFTWLLAGLIVGAAFQYSAIYTTTYLLVALFLTVIKIQEFERGKSDILDSFLEDFYGWTSLLVAFLTMPVAFVFLKDER